MTKTMILTKCGTFLNLSQEVSSISRDSSYKSRIVWVSSNEGIVDWEALSNLGDSVGITVSFTLAIVSIMTISISSYKSRIVWVSSSEGIVDWEAISNLGDSVGITVSFTLAIVSIMTISISSYKSRIVWVSSSEGIVDWEA